MASIFIDQLREETTERFVGTDCRPIRRIRHEWTDSRATC